ncbi:hypothetical protein GO011_11575 [Mycobacterium sp. 20091114027_K0903767]|nr:hypothetical protein [Mycobacterium sp. 20091114027_K0903767]
MSDPNSADETETRTWERLDLPEREAPDGVTADPFGFFGPGTGDDSDL